MRRVDTVTYDDLLTALIIRNQKKEDIPVYEQPYVQIPPPEPPMQRREAEQKEPSRVIIIDI